MAQSVSRLIRIQGIGIQVYSGAPSGWDQEHIITSKVKLRPQIAPGHAFIIFLNGSFPVNVLPAIKAVPEVRHIICASANPVQGRGILGVIDGFTRKGVETASDIEKRKEFLRTIGYKL
ncbi:hypothetical protein KAU37_01645 [Candidatus Bipolaricaulota bacterium]|nr:hypothetical protein [Candidatus Bipolaricaulota bacterium]